MIFRLSISCIFLAAFLQPSVAQCDTNIATFEYLG